jgi:hypothetical protein
LPEKDFLSVDRGLEAYFSNLARFDKYASNKALN